MLLDGRAHACSTPNGFISGSLGGRVTRRLYYIFIRLLLDRMCATGSLPVATGHRTIMLMRAKHGSNGFGIIGAGPANDGVYFNRVTFPRKRVSSSRYTPLADDHPVPNVKM